MRLKKLWMIAVMLAVLVGGNVSAYLLPADFVVEQMAKRSSTHSLFEIHQKTRVFGGETDGEGVDVSEAIFLQRPDRIRVESVVNRTKVIWVRNGGQMVFVNAQGQLQEGGMGSCWPYDFIEAVSAEGLNGKLSSLGMRTQEVHLGRDGEKVFLLLGAKENQPELPQIWIDRDTYDPFRLRFEEEQESKKRQVEVVMRDFGRKVPSFYPATVAVYVDRTLRLDTKVERVLTRDNFAPSLFSLEEMRAKYARSTGSGSGKWSCLRLSEMIARAGSSS